MTERARKAGEHQKPDRAAALGDALSTVPGMTVTREGNDFVVVPESGPPLRLLSEDVVSEEIVTGPNGKAAVLGLLRVDAGETTIIINGGDVGFEPDAKVQVADWNGPAPQVTNAPPMVGYCEVLRDLGACERSFDAGANIDRLFATVAMLRQFLAGAKRVGIDCSESLARWRTLWSCLSER